jgi:hypothetical protein
MRLYPSLPNVIEQLEVLGLVSLGVILGWIVRRFGFSGRLDSAANAMVYALLFLLGIEMSSRMSWLTVETIGAGAALLTVGGVTGSVLMLYIANKLFIRL